MVPDQIDHVPRTIREKIAEDTNTSEGYVHRAEYYAKGIDAAEEVLPSIKKDLLLGRYKPRETEVAAIARAAPEERRERAEKLREPKPTTAQLLKRRNKEYVEIDQIYEDMKAPKNPVGEESILASMQAAVKTMIRVCNMFFGDYPNLLKEKAYKDRGIEIMQEPKQFISEIEGGQP